MRRLLGICLVANGVVPAKDRRCQRRRCSPPKRLSHATCWSARTVASQLSHVATRTDSQQTRFLAAEMQILYVQVVQARFLVLAIGRQDNWFSIFWLADVSVVSQLS